MSCLRAGTFRTHSVPAMREQARPQYCYQVQDFTMPLPKQLEELHMTCNVNHSREALALAVHVLMTEVGFELEGWQETLADGSAKDHPATEKFFWERSDYLMKIGYRHPTCPTVSFSVAFVLFQPNIIVHGLATHEGNTEGFSLSLRLSDFIQRAFLSDPEPNKVYKNLPTLSRLVKDSVALPLLGWAQSVTNVAPTFGFMTLSSEIQLLILGYLNVRDLLAASGVNTDLFELASNPVLWRKLFLKNFPSVEVSPTDNVSNWREKYKQEYLLRKEQQENALQMLPHMRLVMPSALRNAHRPFLLPPVPQSSDDDFDFDMFMPLPPRFGPPYAPQLSWRLDPAFPRPFIGQYNVLPRGVLPHQMYGTGLTFF
ncbi:F-box only protein 7 isoform X4 [Rhipicephalus microplus]|uniref:F-box only protein 7 isoform X4 n=1 Tax=Rhipicephalus microplus TaxID=6941 RepID=UPI0018887D45|nr:F-box only protein 7-like isoform X3 [Rhipicephalus microplus]